jgi:hypothetical protein
MGLLVLNMFVLCSIGVSQNLEWEIMVEHTQTLKSLFIIRYVYLTSFSIYVLSLLRLQRFPLDKNYLFVFWFMPIKSMDTVLRIDPNGLQNLFSHDEVTGTLA